MNNTTKLHDLQPLLMYQFQAEILMFKMTQRLIIQTRSIIEYHNFEIEMQNRC